MTQDILFRAYQSGDENEIIGLLESALNEWRAREKRKLNYWGWMYQDNPLKSNLIYVATKDNEIIGVNHSLLLDAKLGENTVITCYGTDGTIHQDFRGRGIYSKLREMKYNQISAYGVELNYSYTTNQIIIISEGKGDERFPANELFPHGIIRLIRIQDVNLHLKMKPTEKAWIKKMGFHFIKLLNSATMFFNKTIAPKEDFKIIQITNFDNRIDTFWEITSQEYNFIIKRDRGYLNWRYCDPRAGKYVIRQAEYNDQVLGYIVLRLHEYRDTYLTGHIVDILTLPKRMDVADALVKNAVEYFQTNDVNTIDCLVFRGHFLEKILNRNGFINRREKLYIRYHLSSKREGMNIIEDSLPNELYLCHGDLFLI